MKGLVTFIAFVLLGCALIFIYSVREPTLSPGLRPEISQDENRQDEAYKNAQMDLPTYIDVHIAELSPVQETLGGTFYVSDVQYADGKGVARFEDGHMHYVADFAYRGSDTKGWIISKFKIRDQ